MNADGLDARQLGFVLKSDIIVISVADPRMANRPPPLTASVGTWLREAVCLKHDCEFSYKQKS